MEPRVDWGTSMPAWTLQISLIHNYSAYMGLQPLASLCTRVKSQSPQRESSFERKKVWFVCRKTLMLSIENMCFFDQRFTKSMSMEYNSISGPPHEKKIVHCRKSAKRRTFCVGRRRGRGRMSTYDFAKIFIKTAWYSEKFHLYEGRGTQYRSVTGYHLCRFRMTLKWPWPGDLLTVRSLWILVTSSSKPLQRKMFRVGKWCSKLVTPEKNNTLIVKWKEVVHPSRLCVGRLIPWNSSDSIAATQQDWIPVGCVPPARWPYLPACSVLGGLLPGGACSGGGVVSAQGGWYPSMLWGRPPLWTESHTPVKTLPCPNFVAGGNNTNLDKN